MAVADCPVLADVATGVRVEYETLDPSVIRSDATGAITEFAPDGDGGYDHFITDNGVLETGWNQEDADGNITFGSHFSYSFDPATLLPLQPGSARGGLRLSLAEDGTEEERLPFAVIVGEAETWDLGACSYTAIPFSTFTYAERHFSRLDFAYLPQLGLPVLTGIVDEFSRDAYTITAITKAD